jgi:hypothetical protein
MHTPAPRQDSGAVSVLSRRSLLRLVATGVAAALTPFVAAGIEPTGLQKVLANEHPDPRPGIDGSRVLTEADLADYPDLIGLFNDIRAIPYIADGIRCYCGCADLEGYRSLLSCYEGFGMARFCEICQGQGRLAANRAREGQSLDQIRRATDARYGHGASPSTQDPATSAHCTR